MSADANRELVGRFMAALESTGDLAELDKVCSPDVAQNWRQTMENFSFSERTFTVDDVVSEDAKVAILWSISGVHSAEYAGIPASGLRTSNTGSAFFRINDGRITDVRSYYDAEDLFRQLGATVHRPE
jgi:steroid delta-isomerase-like uncharacterized protein